MKTINEFLEGNKHLTVVRCVHGLDMSCSATEWHPIVKDADGRFYVVRYDTFGGTWTVQPYDYKPNKEADATINDFELSDSELMQDDTEEYRQSLIGNTALNLLAELPIIVTELEKNPIVTKYFCHGMVFASLPSAINSRRCFGWQDRITKRADDTQVSESMIKNGNEVLNYVLPDVDFNITCPHCGVLDTDESFIAVWSGEDDYNARGKKYFVCPDCCASYETCNGCGNYFLHTNSHDLCQACYSEDYAACGNCGDVCHNDDICVNEYGEAFCQDCWQDYLDSKNNHLVHDYGYKPRPIFGRTTTDEVADNKLFIGIELEIDSDNSPNQLDTAQGILDVFGDNENTIYLKADCSLSTIGIEIVSHPQTMLRHLELIPKWQNMLKLIREADYSENPSNSAGIHCHVSKAALGGSEDEIVLNTAKIILIMNRFWNSIVRFTRRDSYALNRYAKPWAVSSNPQNAIELDTMAKNIERNKYNSRYVALNLENANTIEYRIFKNTLNINVFMATIEFCSILTNMAINASLPDIQNMTEANFIDHMVGSSNFITTAMFEV